MVTYPSEKGVHELLFGSVAVERTLLAQTDEIVTSSAKKALGGGVRKINVLGA